MNSSPTSQIKIADFGLSKHFNFIDVLETLVGTVVYMAPMISLSGRRLLDTKSYTVKSDCWSLGVVLYILLSAVGERGKLVEYHLTVVLGMVGAEMIYQTGTGTLITQHWLEQG